MIQTLQTEIEAVVDPADLMHLTHDDLVYVAKCTAEEIRKRRKHNEEVVKAIDQGFGYEYLFGEIARGL